MLLSSLTRSAAVLAGIASVVLLSASPVLAQDRGRGKSPPVGDTAGLGELRAGDTLRPGEPTDVAKPGRERHPGEPEERGQRPPDATDIGPDKTTRRTTTESARAGDAAGYRELADAGAEAGTLFDVGLGLPELTTWTRLVEESGLEERLRTGSYTVFAPTEEAFDRVSRAELDAILADEAKAARVVANHVVPGTVRSDEITGSRKLKTLSGKRLSIRTNRAHKERVQRVHIGEAHIVRPDVRAANGRIHAVDRVLLWGK